MPCIEYEAGMPLKDGKDLGPPGWNGCDAGGGMDKSLGKGMFEGGGRPKSVYQYVNTLVK
jgi:hypothetical protein